MPDTTPTPLVIAHQLGSRFPHILADLPSGVSARAVDPAQPWAIPGDAAILFAVPTRGSAPETPPPGWPGNLRWLHTISTGVDSFPNWIYDVPLVTCGRGANSEPIAEFVLAAILAAEKHLPGIWINDAAGWGREYRLGSLRNRTIGLIGYGSIAQAIAARAASFGCRIVATRRADNAGAGAHGVVFADLDTVLASADHLVIAVPLTAATSGLLGRAALARVKPGVHLINIARGKILDQEALREALDDGRVGLATLDVTTPEPLPAGHWLYTHERVHLSPHISSRGDARAEAVGELFNENLRRFLSGQPLAGQVDPQRGY